jgi:signal transduction histidine kinase
MTAVVLQGSPTTLNPTEAPQHVDTVRALCHDLRQPLAAILLFAGATTGDVQRRLDGILDQAQWLSDMVEGVLAGAAEDTPEMVDVVDVARRCVLRAQQTAECQVALIGTGRAMTVAAPVALGRAICCALDNAVRAAGEGGSVAVHVTSSAHGILIRIIDDGPGLGNVPTNNSLGLTITRALVSSCGGGFELRPGTSGGMVAQIVLPALSSRAIAS